MSSSNQAMFDQWNAESQARTWPKREFVTSGLTPTLLDGRWAVRVSIGAAATERQHVEGLWKLMRDTAGAA